MRYSLHPEVERDLEEAALHLQHKASLKTAAKFMAEFERVAILLVEYPGLGTPMSRGRKIHPLRVFKYSVVYRIVEDGVRILVVRHRRRRPGYGNART
jgi:toxin ParE1/3/4